ncbi:MAG: lipoyl(octanoyl) transferase LipB [Bacteroidota bacterium]
MTQNKQTKIIHLGLIDYQEAWDYQEELFKSIVDKKISNRKLSPEDQEMTENYLIFCQHPHVYTLGKSGKEENLLVNESQLINKEASFYKINRGGDITYHGPGQIVVYPILDLDNFFTDIHKYLRYLEEAVILTLADYGIVAGRIKGLTGVWLDAEEHDKSRKIAAFGVKSSRWVTMHGLAFNIQVNLDYFNNIVPCGIQDRAVTSLDKELDDQPVLSAVEEKLKGHLVSLFEMEVIDEERH